eukprot:TRINITY_DN2416_c0_g1_i3.p1 TRINITY_DN2416_c0_g1~~TRINITY_DN2416_c0_g1_i3.p1  ORF type:complete len:1251 (+),score=220.18 TRINITY_DN2416_c0_g1_i3:205-3957(+)
MKKTLRRGFKSVYQPAGGSPLDGGGLATQTTTTTTTTTTPPTHPGAGQSRSGIFGSQSARGPRPVSTYASNAGGGGGHGGGGNSIQRSASPTPSTASAPVVHVNLDETYKPKEIGEKTDTADSVLKNVDTTPDGPKLQHVVATRAVNTGRRPPSRKPRAVNAAAAAIVAEAKAEAAEEAATSTPAFTPRSKDNVVEHSAPASTPTGSSSSTSTSTSSSIHTSGGMSSSSGGESKSRRLSVHGLANLKKSSPTPDPATPSAGAKSDAMKEALDKKAAEEQKKSGVVNVGQKQVMRVFLEDDTMKTLPVTIPCEAQHLVEMMKKKCPTIDTSGFALFEYNGKTEVRQLDSLEEVTTIATAGAAQSFSFRLVCKKGRPGQVNLDIIIMQFPNPPETIPEIEKCEDDTPATSDAGDELPPLQAPVPVPTPNSGAQKESRPSSTYAGQSSPSQPVRPLSRPPSRSNSQTGPRPQSISYAAANNNSNSATTTATTAKTPSSEATKQSDPQTSSSASLTQSEPDLLLPPPSSMGALPTPPAAVSASLAGRPVPPTPGARSSVAMAGGAAASRTPGSTPPPSTTSAQQQGARQHSSVATSGTPAMNNTNSAAPSASNGTGSPTVNTARVSVPPSSSKPTVPPQNAAAAGARQPSRPPRQSSGPGTISPMGSPVTQRPQPVPKQQQPPSSTETPSNSTGRPAPTPRPKSAYGPRGADSPAPGRMPVPATPSPTSAPRPAIPKPAGGAPNAQPKKAGSGPATKDSSLSNPIFDEREPGKETIIRVYFKDGTFRSVCARSNSTVNDLYKDICFKFKELDLSDHCIFHVRGSQHRQLLDNELALALHDSFTNAGDKLQFKNREDVPTSRKKVLRVYFVDSTFKSFQAVSDDSVHDMAQQVASKLKLAPAGYTLYTMKDAVATKLNDADLVIDVQETWATGTIFVFANSVPVMKSGFQVEPEDLKPVDKPAEDEGAEPIETTGQRRMSFRPSSHVTGSVPQGMNMARIAQEAGNVRSGLRSVGNPLQRRHNEAMQIQALTQWFDFHMAKRDYYIQNLETDVCDGVLLVNLVEIMCNTDLGVYLDQPDMTITQKMDNANKALKHLNSIGLAAAREISAEDILDGNSKLLLGVLWAIIYCSIPTPFNPRVTEAAAKRELLSWVHSSVTSIRSTIRVDNFDASWSDGVALCALVAKYRPDVLTFDAIASLSREKRVDTIMQVLEEHLGMPPIVQSTALNSDFPPDERAIIALVVALKERLLTTSSA